MDDRWCLQNIHFASTVIAGLTAFGGICNAAVFFVQFAIVLQNCPHCKCYK
jgi:hypothetical protein